MLTKPAIRPFSAWQCPTSLLRSELASGLSTACAGRKGRAVPAAADGASIRCAKAASALPLSALPAALLAAYGHVASGLAPAAHQVDIGDRAAARWAFGTRLGAAAGSELSDSVGVVARLRDALRPDGLARELRGRIVVDETYIGRRQKGKPGRGAAHKSVVIGLKVREGRVRSLIVPSVATDR